MVAASQSNSTTLIVDFPVSVRSRSVSFSPQSQGRYIEYPSRKENQARWNSGSDYDYFQQVMIRDAVKCSAMLAAVNERQDVSRREKHIICCVGLDHLISHDVKQRCRAIKEARKAHVETVLSAQKWQRRHNVYAATDLARVSQANSQRARERSFKVAVLSASVL